MFIYLATDDRMIKMINPSKYIPIEISAESRAKPRLILLILTHV